MEKITPESLLKYIDPDGKCFRPIVEIMEELENPDLIDKEEIRTNIEEALQSRIDNEEAEMDGLIGYTAEEIKYAEKCLKKFRDNKTFANKAIEIAFRETKEWHEFRNE